MPVTLAEMGLDRLSFDDKLDLVSRLWDDILTAVPPGGLLSDAQRDELRRRVADAEANPNDFVTWENALVATMKRLSS